tara:strand:+ start:256 stop:366 length:111 start_codon:yes stop_codon:yes gene_type:complete
MENTKKKFTPPEIEEVDVEDLEIEENEILGVYASDS